MYATGVYLKPQILFVNCMTALICGITLNKFNFLLLSAWVLGWLMCKTVPYIQGVSVAASVYSLIAVSLDR